VLVAQSPTNSNTITTKINITNNLARKFPVLLPPFSSLIVPSVIRSFSRLVTTGIPKPITDSTTNKITTRRLPTLTFLMLILQHVLPKGLQRVRDYGLLSSGAKKVRLIIQLLLLPVHDWLTPKKEENTPSRATRIALAVNIKCIARVFHERPSRKANTIRIMAIVNNKEKGE